LDQIYWFSGRELIQRDLRAWSGDSHHNFTFKRGTIKLEALAEFFVSILNGWQSTTHEQFCKSKAASANKNIVMPQHWRATPPTGKFRSEER
jgi:hypothetical protein